MATAKKFPFRFKTRQPAAKKTWSSTIATDGGGDLPDVPRFGDVAQRLVENGYKPVPLHFGKKNPTPQNWTQYELDAKDIRGTFAPHRRDGTGIMTGEIVALDIDVRAEIISAEIELLAETMLGNAPRRIGAAPKVLRIYRTDEAFSKITSAGYMLPGDAEGAKPHRVEVLGRGQQFVAFNIHPDTMQPYTWNGAGDPLTVPAAELVTVSRLQMVEFIERANGLLTEYAFPAGAYDLDREAVAHAPVAPATIGVPGLPEDLENILQRDAEDQAQNFERGKVLKARDPDECRAALCAIPNNDVPYDRYVKLGYAIAGAMGADGRDGFHEWSAKSRKYNIKKTEADWQSFMAAAAAGKLRSGAGTIYREAMAAGWERPEPGSLIRKIPAEWLSTPPPKQKWLADKLIPMACVTAVLAEGGVGKSFAVLTLAEATAHGSKHWWSVDDERVLVQGSVVYVAAEDTLDIIRSRVFAIRSRWVSRMAKVRKGKALADAIDVRDAETRKHLHFAPIVGMDIHLIDTTTGEVKQGPGVDRLIGDLRDIDNLVLVVLDPLSRLHGGDENSNSVSTALIIAAERVAQEFGCAVVVLHHVSKQAASDKNISAHAGRGGSALGDGARSVLRLLPAEGKEVKGVKLLRRGIPVMQADVDEGNVVRIVHAKNSYGPRQRDMFLLRDTETGELLTLKVVKDDRDPDAVALAALAAWLASNPVIITKDTFREATDLRKKVFFGMSKNAWLAWFDGAVLKGDLVEDPAYQPKNRAARGYRLADTRHTRPIPASGSAGIEREEVVGSVGGRIAATGPTPVAAGIFGGYPDATGSKHKKGRARA